MPRCGQCGELFGNPISLRKHKETCASKIAQEQSTTLQHFQTPADLEESPFAIQHYLSPRFFEQPELLEQARHTIRAGDVAVLTDAFNTELAESVHCELDQCTNWTHHQDFNSSGFHYSHHNVYNESHLEEQSLKLRRIFSDPATISFLEHLSGAACLPFLLLCKMLQSGRDCSGPIIGTPSFYQAGDHSLPHTDQMDQRTVAYVWHLAKAWQPEWGGALYWIPTPKYFHCSFNTLYLFSVTPRSQHFVTQVSREATEKRLAFNGWWQSGWLPSNFSEVEEMLSTGEKRMSITGAQMKAMEQIVPNVLPTLLPSRRESFIKLGMKYSQMMK